jgi:hypothetical protein
MQAHAPDLIVLACVSIFGPEASSKHRLESVPDRELFVVSRGLHGEPFTVRGSEIAQEAKLKLRERGSASCHFGKSFKISLMWRVADTLREAVAGSKANKRALEGGGRTQPARGVVRAVFLQDGFGLTREHFQDVYGHFLRACLHPHDVGLWKCPHARGAGFEAHCRLPANRARTSQWQRQRNCHTLVSYRTTPACPHGTGVVIHYDITTLKCLLQALGVRDVPTLVMTLSRALACARLPRVDTRAERPPTLASPGLSLGRLTLA